MEENRQLLQQMVERRAETLLNSIDGAILPLFKGNPAIQKMASKFIMAKKKEYLPHIQNYCDVLVETAYLDPDIPIEEAIANAEEMVQEFVDTLLSEKLQVPAGVLSISLKALFGNKLFKL